MNTKPDEMLLALWLEDELEGEELAAVEAWAGSQPEQIAAREEVRNWKKWVGEAVPRAEEPPYPDFFNSRIESAIRKLGDESKPKPAPAPAAVPFWKTWFLPAGAFAGMALAFWMGTKTGESQPGLARSGQEAAGDLAPLVYSPELGVDAQWYASSPASAAVIVLQGVNAIPDSTDFSETVMIPMSREIDSTAGQPAGSGH